MKVAATLSTLLFFTAVIIVSVQVATALTPSDVSAIAKKITVRIDSSNDKGSGVIIERKGKVYTVITNWHVVDFKGNYTLTILKDGKEYTYKFNHSQVKKLSGVDLAVFEFTSNQDYILAEKGDSDQITEGKTIYLGGYPAAIEGIPGRNFQFLHGAITSRVQNPQNGYALVYTVEAFQGMSGGPILDEQGKLVGIQGRAATELGGGGIAVFGIPLKTYLQIAGIPTKPSPPIAKKPSPSVTKVSIVSSSSTNFDLWKTLQGHFRPVTSISFSPNGKTLASGSRDMTIKLWNVETGMQTRTLQGHSDQIDSVTYSPDGKILASSSDDETIKLWDVATGREIRTLQGSFFSIYSVTFNPDGKTLASGSEDGTIKLWNVATGTEILSLQGHSSKVSSVTFSPDGRTLASGSVDGTIKLWNVAMGTEIRTIEGHSDRVDSVAFSRDGTKLASGSRDNTTKLWDVSTGREIYIFPSNSSVTAVIFSPDGKTLASGSDDSSIKLWNLETGKEIRTINSNSASITSLTISPDGKTLASGSDDNTIKLWQLSK